MQRTARAARLRVPALAALSGVVALAAAVAFGSPFAPRVRKDGPVYRIERGAESYSFDAVWRVESLWTRSRGGADWRRVPGPDPSRLEPYRRDLLRHLRRSSPLEIPAEGAADLRALRALGYI